MSGLNNYGSFKFNQKQDAILGSYFKLLDADRIDLGIPIAPQNQDPTVYTGSTPAIDTGTRASENLYLAKRYDDYSGTEQCLGVCVKPMEASGTNDDYAGLGQFDRKLTIMYRGEVDMIFARTGWTGLGYHASGGRTYYGMPVAPHPSGFMPRTHTGEAYLGYCLEPGVGTGEYARIRVEPRREMNRLNASGGVFT